MIVRRVVTVGVATTLAAGLVGVVRQRDEVARARRGELIRAGAASEVAPVRPPGRVGAWLGTWVPVPPRSPWGRAAAWAWASPLTIAGLVVALASGRWPRYDADHACLVVEGVRGPSAAALRLVGAEANTIGHVVLSRHPRSPAVLLAHEAVHVRQGERFGPLLFPAYLWLAARFGYRDHPLERAARAGARAAASADLTP